MPYSEFPEAWFENRENRLYNLSIASSSNNLGAQHDNTALGRERGINTAAWMNRDPQRLNTPLPPPPGDNNKDRDPQQQNPWILPVLVRLNNVNVSVITPIPININNNVTCVDFQLDSDAFKTPSLRALVDSGVAMNSGNLGYHWKVVSQFPDIVVEYIECGPGTK